MLGIWESSDEEAATAFSLNVIAQGNLRGETLRAFTAAEMEKILAKAG
jgi:uncharacterized protein with GYD domain